MIEMSLTLVPVNPVKMRSSSFEKKEYESFSNRNFLGFNPNSLACSIVFPSVKAPAVEEFLKAQGRFAHLFKPECRKDVIDDIQRNVDANWNRITKLSTQN